jgi:hypothetical protein
MPYTIQMFGTEDQAQRLRTALDERIATSRFTAVLSPPAGRPATRRERHPSWYITVRPVRLREAKPYCGQHPGECLVERKKPTNHLLEWDDWVEFHKIVNDVLDDAGVQADVWSVPGEPLSKGSKMWIRRDGHRRVPLRVRRASPGPLRQNRSRLERRDTGSIRIRNFIRDFIRRNALKGTP